MGVTAVTGQDHSGHYAHCACGWWVRCLDGKAALMQAWRHKCRETDGEAEDEDGAWAFRA